MQVMGFSEFRKNLAGALDYVQQTQAPMIITRQGGASAVVMSLEEYNAHQETLYLLSNPYNADHLMRAVRAVKDAQLVQKGLVDCEHD